MFLRIFLYSLYMCPYHFLLYVSCQDINNIICRKQEILLFHFLSRIFSTFILAICIYAILTVLSLFLSHSEILPFSENILCHSLPPLWAFTWPVVYSYFNFKSYSYFIPVLYFRNILSSLPEDLPRGHSEGIHFIPLRFIPSRFGWTILSSRAYVLPMYTYTLPSQYSIYQKKEWTLNIVYFSTASSSKDTYLVEVTKWIIIACIAFPKYPKNFLLQYYRDFSLFYAI